MSLLAPTQHARPRFRPLTVTAVEPCGEAAASLTLAVPDELAGEYLQFTAGQHVTVRARIGGEGVRQSYSVSVTPRWARTHRALRIGVARVPGGRMSTWLTEQVAVGDVIDVLAPMGEFGHRPARGSAGTHVALAGGSGITPVLSIVRTVLEEEPASRVVLLYGTRSPAATMYAEELAALAASYAERFRLVLTHSREAGEDALLGRIDAELAARAVGELGSAAVVDHWWLCGPERLVDDATGWLAGHGVPPERVHHEVFHTVHHRA